MAQPLSTANVLAVAPAPTASHDPTRPAAAAAATATKPAAAEEFVAKSAIQSATPSRTRTILSSEAQTSRPAGSGTVAQPGFERIRVVGRGAFGTAVLYRRQAELVVVKEIILSDLKPFQRELALNEAKLLALLDHPNIISYYDSSQEGDTLRIEMEYAENGNLRQWLATRKGELLPHSQLLSLFKQITLGLEYVHANRILHRDLKTANVFLTKKGRFHGFHRISIPLISPHFISSVLCLPLFFFRRVVHHFWGFKASPSSAILV